jgi:hypothetical protein
MRIWFESLVNIYCDIIAHVTHPKEIVKNYGHKFSRLT